MKRLLLSALLLVSPLAWHPARAAEAGAAASCAVSPELLEDEPGFPNLARRLKAGQPVTIVAIGGASTAGAAAGPEAANSFPSRLEEALRKRHPNGAITVINRGVPRQTAREMLERFPADVLAHKPALVIWETGTVDAVRDLDVEDFAAALKEGIDTLHDHKIDVMLVDMQFNPRTSSIINFEPYLDALHRTADLEDVYLFRRYDIMRAWSDSGRFDLVGVPAGKQAALAQEIYRCLGDAMADAIDRPAH